MAIGKGKMVLQPIGMQAKGAGLLVTHPLPDDHPFYALIGRVAAEWARLEHTLDEIIWDLAETPEDASSCVTSQILGHSSKFKAIYALVQFRRNNGQMLKRIRSLQGIVVGLSDERNRYVHDAWFSQTPDEPGNDISWVGQFKSISTKNKMFGIHPIAESEITTFINKVKTETDKIAKLRTDLLENKQP